MERAQVLYLVAGLVGVGGLGFIGYLFLGGGGSRRSELRELMASAARVDSITPSGTSQQDLDDINEIKKRTGSAEAKSKSETVAKKLFKAGYFSAEDKKRFTVIHIVFVVACVISAPIFFQIIGGKPFLVLVGLVMGFLIGVLGPLSWLDKKVRERQEDTLYYLPLVIEQVSIGVSSSLDIGPCISHIVEMADERDSHNPVTEMFVHVEKLIRSGLNLEDALVDVGDTNGMTEVKHAFMFLAQCSKHGGEVSKQLQELADSVMVQRQVQVEGKITALPVRATGPLATVFAGFFALLFAGLLVRLMSAFGN